MSENYIPKIAKMLGVEVGEEFFILSPEAEKFGPYMFQTDANRLFFKTNSGDWRLDDDDSICDLLFNGWEIVKKPWKPKDGEMFYWCKFINGALYVVGRFFNTAAGGDIACYRLGNCYRTKEEAEANRERWEEFYRDDSPIDWRKKK